MADISFDSNKAINLMDPNVKSIDIKYINGGDTEIRREENKTCEGESESCIVNFNDGSRKRFQASTSHRFGPNDLARIIGPELGGRQVRVVDNRDNGGDYFLAPDE
ncbi:hypothetical protein FE257_008213 [Aspergillus nanangensis]|uniref:Uncharacterized protein n=1 Tax=Aspergillus nanangensis TaxID=2582783 RepID=A0AAD4CLQ9_ASPNN|nr:hypothetical protein FE257_008213 [Aspergillus nanangensis]